ncbi:ABC transporter substrate-binding protein [Natribacillus halophilus]|uniref:Peptide/nickel transport system substrate-binding protein n=1 Tax=Natribacillus halophilus TaxID=549003 RepID=A0A1G8R7T7_9BACI|nr:ABC transporter substrate-binding protein [Natribacillus halophilus]SDJ13021.1 peptide/nickel transport system substrate-binding protein [Natribacillus halophilus]
MRLFRGHFLVSLFMLMLLVGCNGEAETTEDEADDEAGNDVEQEMTFAMTDDPVGLSPIGTWDTISDLPVEQMYDRLFERDAETGEIEASIVESYDNVDDETWVFELREDIEFHDETPLNAEAVVYTFEEFVDSDNANPGAHVLDFMESVEATDEFTVELTTDGPSSNVLPALANRSTSIISPQADQNQDLMEEPVGSGPFEFESWDQGDSLEMTRNENYWGDEPALEHITFLTVPDESTALSMLETGEVDLVEDIDSEQMDRVEGMQDVSITDIEGTAGYWLSFNMEEAPMDELEFRQAVAMGVDIESYMTQLEGVAFESNSLFGPGVPDYDESIEDAGYDYDPEAAQELVEENSYDEYEVDLYTSDRSAYQRMSEVAQAQLAEIGLDINIEMMDWETMLDVTADAQQDMYALGSSNSMNGLETLDGYFHSSSVGANNRAQYANDDFDAIVEEAGATIDEEDRQELVNEAHEHVIDEALIIPMHHDINILAHNDSLQGVELHPDVIFSLEDAYME